MSEEEKFTREELEKAMVDAKRLLDEMDEEEKPRVYAACPHCGYAFLTEEDARKPGPCPNPECGERGEPVVIKYEQTEG